jgi:hypothetical protein
MKTEFTILFITKNRTDIVSSLNSIVQIKKYYSNIKLIVLDGNKSTLLKKNFKVLKRSISTKIIKQKRNGFMNACLQAANYVKDGYFTFMYDDDILSPHFGRLVKYACTKKKQVYGYGKIYPKNKIFQFKIPKINKICNYKTNFLNEYFAFGSKKVLPNSPITSVFNAKIIEKWKSILQEKIKDKMTYYFLMKKNIGPDLLIYLLALEEDNNIGNTFISKNYVAKFSSHFKSMSIRHGSVNLKLGYWLAKNLFLNNKKNSINFPFKIYFNHMVKGFFIFVIYSLSANKFKRFSFINYVLLCSKLIEKIFCDKDQ